MVGSRPKTKVKGKMVEMSFLKTDSEKVKSVGMPESGTYEVFIKAVDPNKVAKSTGNSGMEILYIIRDDVKQPFKGSKIYDNIYDGAEFRYHQLAFAVGADDGQVFETRKDFADFLKGKALRVTVKQEDYTWNGQTKKRLRVERVEPSEFAEGFVAPVEQQANNDDTFGNGIEIDEEHIPF